MSKQTTLSVIIVLAAIAVIVYMQIAHYKNPDDSSLDKNSQMDNQSQIEDTNNSTITPMTTEETTTTNDIKITVLKKGTGDGAVNGDTVTVNYTGMFPGGEAFDSNVDPKFNHVEPFRFELGAGMVIKGWDQGVLGMKVGEKRHLVIPASLGYGATGAGGVIPPNATLEFDVEVTAISRKR